MHVLMIATENDALPGGKVGGIGDVIRDLPPALARQEQEVSVVTPGYGHLSRIEGAQQVKEFSVSFAGKRESLQLFRVPALHSHAGVSNWVIEHDLFSAGGAGTIYCTRDREPFATDAHKFTLFCTAVAEALKQNLLGDIDLLHCHDWHAAPLLLLRAAAPRYRFLREMTAVYTIHNLSIQGVRPLRDNRSSLESWFPDMLPDRNVPLDKIVDPAHPSCINWMRAGIVLADKVHAVSPNYAREILQPTNQADHFIGGEHLEADLQQASDEGRLVGILNGCDYSQMPQQLLGKGRLAQIIDKSLRSWVEGRSSIPAAHFYALKRLANWQARRRADNFVVTSVGRLTGQKCRLLRESVEGRSVLESLLDELKDGFFIMLGTGEADYEDYFTRIMAERDNFLFLQGFSDGLAQALYSFGDLFLMPSSFEPCGISQMLAMRAATPCLVHAVGGLADTVEDGVNGFSFGGKGLQVQARHLLQTFARARKLKLDKPPRWREMCRQAGEARFSWDDSATAMLRDLYFRDYYRDDDNDYDHDQKLTASQNRRAAS